MPKTNPKAQPPAQPQPPPERRPAAAMTLNFYPWEDMPWEFNAFVTGAFHMSRYKHSEDAAKRMQDMVDDLADELTD